MEINVRLTIEPRDKLAELQSEEETLSHIRSALYGRMGDFGWRSVRVEMLPPSPRGEVFVGDTKTGKWQHIGYTEDVVTDLPPALPFGPTAHCRACAASGVGVCDDYPNCPAGRAEVKLEVHEDKSLENILERLHNAAEDNT